VPATSFETSGAKLLIGDLLPLRSHPKVIGLAEFMNFPGVLHKEPDILDKLVAFQDGHIDGHAPLVRGYDLNGYLAANIRTDHETTIADDGREKLRKGMTVLIREGSITKDLHALAEILTESTSSFCCLCTDDRNPLDLVEQGQLDYMVRTLIRLGRPLHHVYRSASWSAAVAFGLRDRGIIAPGRRADILLVGSLEACDIKTVISAGRVVDDALFAARRKIAPVGLDSVRAPKVTAADFVIPGGSAEVQMIGVATGRIVTDRVIKRVPSTNAERRADPANDIAKVAVVERHGKNGNIGKGFVTGFGLKRGAIASTVGHDSHNICVVGVDDGDIAFAVNRLSEINGGYVVVAGGKVLAELPLHVAGLMSTEPFEAVTDKLRALRKAATELGSTMPDPFLISAFLPLPVIPHMKITDYGLFDVDKFELVEM
jgi:adenine deaminase